MQIFKNLSHYDRVVLENYQGLQKMGLPTDTASLLAQTKLDPFLLECRLASLKRRGYIKEEGAATTGVHPA